jgi:hypothetical protein
MPKLEISIEHALAQIVALERIKNLLTRLKAEYGSNISELTEKWDENGSEFSFKAMGMAIEGNIIVMNNKVNLEAKIPLAAIPFKGMIEKTISNEAKKLLG